MAFEIVDGMTGTKHISSDDLSALNVATIGKANCVLKYGDDFKLTMASANSATLGTGVGMVGGKRFWNQAATSLTVQSGTQGQTRNDLVVARYAKTSAGIESITPVVIKGTPSTGTAADPATTSNDLKLWRIPLNGISVGTPVKLFDPVASLATLEDFVSPIEFNIVTRDKIYIDGVVVRGMAIINVWWENVGNFTSYAWGDTALAMMKGWTTTHETHAVFIDNLGSLELQAARYLHVGGSGIYFRTSYETNIRAGAWHMGQVIVPVVKA